MKTKLEVKHFVENVSGYSTVFESNDLTFWVNKEQGEFKVYQLLKYKDGEHSVVEYKSKEQGGFEQSRVDLTVDFIQNNFTQYNKANFGINQNDVKKLGLHIDECEKQIKKYRSSQDTCKKLYAVACCPFNIDQKGILTKKHRISIPSKRRKPLMLDGIPCIVEDIEYYSTGGWKAILYVPANEKYDLHTSLSIGITKKEFFKPDGKPLDI